MPWGPRPCLHDWLPAVMCVGAGCPCPHPPLTLALGPVLDLGIGGDPAVLLPAGREGAPVPTVAGTTSPGCLSEAQEGPVAWGPGSGVSQPS